MMISRAIIVRLLPTPLDIFHTSPLDAGYFLSSRPSSALLDKHEESANSTQAGCESQKATISWGSFRISDFVEENTPMF
jgi:hypothetical protein